MSSFFIKKLDILIMRINKILFTTILILDFYCLNFYNLVKFTFDIF